MSSEPSKSDTNGKEDSFVTSSRLANETEKTRLEIIKMETSPEVSKARMEFLTAKRKLDVASVEEVVGSLKPIIEMLGNGIGALIEAAASADEREKAHELALVAANPEYAMKRLALKAEAAAAALAAVPKVIEEAMKKIASSVSAKKSPLKA